MTTATASGNQVSEKKIECSPEQRQFLEDRKEAGKLIDPDRAEVDWWYIRSLDPYGIYPDLPPEADQVGRGYFAKNPDNDVWVEFGDIQPVVREKLWGKFCSSQTFESSLDC